MADWKDKLDEKLQQSEQEKQRYSVILPQSARHEFYGLFASLEQDAKEINAKYEHVKGRISVYKEPDGKIIVDKNDWPSYHYAIELSSDGKQIVIECSSRRSASDNHLFRPAILTTSLDDRNNVHFWRDGAEVTFAQISEMIFMPILTEKDFQ